MNEDFQGTMENLRADAGSQQAAFDDVLQGLANHERDRLIMACVGGDSDQNEGGP